MRRDIHIASFITLLTSMLFSCTAKEEGAMQPYSSNSDDALTSQAVIGREQSKTHIRRWAPSDNGSFCSYGPINSFWGIAQIDIDGAISWQRDPLFAVSGLCAINATIGAGGYAFAAIGNGRAASQGNPPEWTIAIYDHDGRTIAYQQTAYPGYNIQLFGVQLVSSEPAAPVLFVAGAAERNNITYPFAALYGISGDSTIALLKGNVYSDCPNEYFLHAAWNEDELSPRYFVSSMSSFSGGSVEPSTTDCWNDLIVCIDDTLAIVWKRSIAPSGTSRSNIRAMEFSNGAIYAIGRALAAKSDGQQWETGLVASVAESGELSWTKSIILSTFAEEYYDLEIHSSTLYAVGQYAFSVVSAGDRCYSYALLSRFDLASGEVIGHSTFGGIRYSSGFRAIEIDGNSAICGGWTNWYIYDYWFQGWLVEIDIPSLAGFSDAPCVPAEERKGSSPRACRFDP